jgi:membrane-bound lytic murein transglycosylase D
MKTFFLVFIIFSSFYAQAQTTLLKELREKMNKNENREVTAVEPDSSLIVPEAWDTNLDNLLNSWYVMHHTNKLNHTGYQENVPISDSVYVERLSQLPNIIELPYNDVVRNCINFYVERRRDLVEYMLGLETFYFPMIEETLDKYDMPLELKYLTIVESALNPVALSRAGALGLWQFMLPTGKFYGLEINTLVDERRDPIKSTDAACRYLKDLYDTFEDWNLAIAAYNCGAGNVNKAIKRSGKKDYWAIYPYLPRETRSYLPFFVAANYVMNYYAYHQLYPVQTSLPFSTDTVMVNQLIHFDQIAEVLQMDKDAIRSLNPQYKKDIIPGNSKPRILKLPAIQAYAFVEKENEIVTYRADELFTNRTYAGTNTIGRQERITHKVAKGETLITIANKYGVTTTSIRKWNGLRSNRVASGKNLILYVDNGGYTASNKMVTSTEKQTLFTASDAKTTNNSSQPSVSAIPTTRYKVQSGDSFYTIAQNYPGYSHTDLMKLNNMKNSNLKVGQYIKVPKI